MAGPEPNPTQSSLRLRLHRVIFEAETPTGKAFDIILLGAIILSVIAVMLESVASIRDNYERALLATEWVFTIFFTIEYVTRLATVRRPGRYALSFFGLVDLVAILPTYLSLFIPGSQSLLVIRSLRLIRAFRVFKLGRYVGEGELLMNALRMSREKIIVFLVGVMTLVIILGSTMYLVEGTFAGDAGAASGFTSIPQSIYWSIVTMTTVGYGDIAPQTVPGKILASAIMIIGYGIIAVPTGIVTSEVIEAHKKRDGGARTTRTCPECTLEGHRTEAEYCRRCGARLSASSGNGQGEPEPD